MPDTIMALLWFLLILAIGEAMKLILGHRQRTKGGPGPHTLRIVWDGIVGFTILSLFIQVIWNELPSIQEFYQPFTTGTRQIVILSSDYPIIVWGSLLLFSILCVTGTSSVLLRLLKSGNLT